MNSIETNAPNPYDAPRAVVADPALADPSSLAAFRPLDGLVKWLKMGLAAYLAVSLLSGFSSLLQALLLEGVQNGQSITQEAAEANDKREQMVGVLFLLVYIVTAILFFRWTVVSKRNAAALGARGLQFTPAWSVGWYFVPIATLWKPYQALKETFEASHPDYLRDWKAAPHPGLMPIWWTIWLIGNSLSQVDFRLSMRADTIPELITASWLGVAEAVLEIPLVVVVWAMATTMRNWQAAKFDALRNAAATATSV